MRPILFAFLIAAMLASNGIVSACPPVSVGFMQAAPTFNPVVPVAPQQAVCTGGCGLPAQGFAQQAQFAEQYAAPQFAQAPVYQQQQFATYSAPMFAQAAPVYQAPVFAQQSFASYAVAAPAFAVAQPVYATQTVGVAVGVHGGRHARVIQRRATRAARRSVVGVPVGVPVGVGAVSVGVGVY